MKFHRRGGISPIIATLLLIAIAVAAGIIVYVFVNSLAGGLTGGGGQQTTERLQLQTYNFVISPSGGTSCSCANQLAEMFLLNSGSATTTISSVYYDGTLQSTLSACPLTGSGTDVTPTTLSTYYDSAAAYLTSSAASKFGCSVAGAASQLTVTVGSAVQVIVTLSAAPSAGTSHIIKVVSTTGATNVFTVTTGRTG